MASANKPNAKQKCGIINVLLSRVREERYEWDLIQSFQLFRICLELRV
jgi:hypothetical protein